MKRSVGRAIGVPRPAKPARQTRYARSDDRRVTISTGAQRVQNGRVDCTHVPRMPRRLRRPRHPGRADLQASHAHVPSRPEMYLGSA